MPGFFDITDPQSSLPLLGLLQGLGQAAAPSRTPVPFGQVIGQAAQGLMGGRQAQQQYGIQNQQQQLNAMDLDLKKQQLRNQENWQNLFNTPTPPVPVAPTTNAGSNPDDVFNAVFNNHIAPHEGSTYIANEPANGNASRFGVNQGANPDVDVKNLTLDGAKDIAKNRYWKASGSDQLASNNPQLAAVNMDAAWAMGPTEAKRLLDASGGDPEKYIALMKQKYQAIAKANPAKAMYISGWMKRADDLDKFIKTLPGPSQNQNTAMPATMGPNFTPYNAATNPMGLPAPFGQQPTQTGAQPTQTPQGGQAPQTIQDVIAGLTPAQRQILGTMSQEDGMKYLQTLTRPATPAELEARNLPPDASAEVGVLGKGFHILDKGTQAQLLSPEEKKANGFAEDDIVQKSSTGYKILVHGDKANGYLKPEQVNTIVDNVIAHGGDYNIIRQAIGYGDPADRAKIISALNAKMAKMGVGPADLLAKKSILTASQQSLNDITKTLSRITSSEQTTAKNADVALSLANATGPAGIPVIDRWIQAGRQATGDPDVAAFATAIRTLSDEYSRVMTTSTGTSGAALSDHARELMDQLLNKAMTKEQLESTIAVMKRDMANRASSYQEVQGGLSDTIKKLGSTDVAPPAAGSTGPKIVKVPQSEINSDAAAMNMTPGNFLWYMRTKHGVTIQAQ